MGHDDADAGGPPQPPSRAERANAAAMGAAHEAGGGQTDAIMCGCDLIRIGVFFDGTNNFRDFAGQQRPGEDEPRSWHTNPDLLEELYDDTEGSPIDTVVEGATRTVQYAKHYMRGIGVKANGDFSWFGPGIGMGYDGVASRVDQALELVREDVRTLSQGIEPCDIWFDTFGFSRGAAAARDFANHIADGDVTRSGSRVRTKFMGIFDTVSSIGMGGRTGGMPNVKLRTANKAETIVHLTAQDEIRKNFPLTGSTGKTVPMVGVHGDIGGGYSPGTNGGTLSFASDQFPGVADVLTERWGVTPNGGPSGGGEILTARNATRYIPTGYPGPPVSVPYVDYNFAWTAEQGIQHVALRLMHQEAVNAGVPFPETLPGTIAGKSVAIGGLLQTYWEAVKDAPHRASDALETQVRHAHAHFSSNNYSTWGISPFLPETSGERRIGSAG